MEAKPKTGLRVRDLMTAPVFTLYEGDSLFQARALFDLRALNFAGGAVHDPVGSLLLCASPNAAYTVVNGRVVVREGRLATLELGPLIEHHNRLALQLANHA